MLYYYHLVQKLQLVEAMGEFCLQDYAGSQYQVYLGFCVFVVFFGLLCYCEKSGERRRQRERQAKTNIDKPSKIVRYSFKKSNQPQPQPHHLHPKPTNIQDQNSQQSQNSSQNQNDPQPTQQPHPNKIGTGSAVGGGQAKKYKFKNLKDTVKKLSAFAYNYVENQHLVTHSYRNQEAIRKERELYLLREERKVEVSPKKEEKKEEKKVQESESRSGIKRTESHTKLSDFPKKQKQASISLIPSAQSSKQIPPPNIGRNDPISLFTQPSGKISLAQPNNTKPGQNMFNNIKPTGQLFSTQPQPQPQPQPKPPIPSEQKTNPNEKPEPPKTNNTANNNLPTPSVQVPKQPLFPKLQTTTPPPNPNPKPNTTQNPPKQPQKKPEQQLPSSTQPNPSKITSSIQYLTAIIKYSSEFSIKTQITTNINNLNGARSDPKQLWLFASAYIKTINPNNHDEVVTFSYRIWDAVVNKFMKNTNIKDGFEKIPPKEKNKQVQKNSINTYVILINVFRVMGFQAVWLGVFGKTLNMLNFLYTRKDPIQKWEKLQLLQMKYVTLDGDVSSKYQSRIDFLTYFLLALTTLDPIEAFEEISEKTGEAYPFIDELKRYKYKWSYRQFWCLIDAVKKNPLQAYFKIPFWNNALSVIYLQMLKSLKQGQLKQFEVLSQWIIKQIKQITKKHEESPERKILEEQAYENREKGYQFDGDQFINGIKTLGRGIDTKEREMKQAMRASKWEDFRDKCSILYYFWRKDTA